MYNIKKGTLMEKIFAIVTIFVLIFSLYFFDKKSEQKFAWLPSESADSRFPMQIIEGDFILSNGQSIYIPSGSIINNGLGNIGSTHIVGKEFKSLPSKLNIIWFSFYEDKFYQAEFDLPKDILLEHFKKGYIHYLDNSQSTYNRISVGLGLNGYVSLFIAAAPVKEIAVFKGKPIEIDWIRVIDNPDISREEFVSYILKNYSKNYSLEKEINWENFLKKYEWNLNFSNNIEINSFNIHYFNGEVFFYDKINNPFKKDKYSIPKEIIVDFTYKDTNLITYITLSEKEIYNIFSEINTNDSLEFLIEFKENDSSIHLYFKTGNQKIYLKETEIKLYSR